MSRALSENLVQYVVDNASVLTEAEIVDSVLVDTDPDSCILIREVPGGTSRSWPDNRQDVAVQVLARATDDYTARIYIFDAWDTLRIAEHGVTLPASTVATGSTTVLVARLDIGQRPASIGIQDDFYWWSFNMTATYFAA